MDMISKWFEKINLNVHDFVSNSFIIIAKEGLIDIQSLQMG